ncbi:unnamed protein product [Hymenolepis diminuta]|uniref:Uncharacterized protein n=1 Tax=Hymenolepis diminuta TaxID=6216 RepID=A0A564XXH9_HYMDI|nr:unnamed protein product [Hymenolepis diminuta]
MCLLSPPLYSTLTSLLLYPDCQLHVIEQRTRNPPTTSSLLVSPAPNNAGYPRSVLLPSSSFPISLSSPFPTHPQLFHAYPSNPAFGIFTRERKSFFLSLKKIHSSEGNI